MPFATTAAGLFAPLAPPMLPSCRMIGIHAYNTEFIHNMGNDWSVLAQRNELQAVRRSRSASRVTCGGQNVFGAASVPAMDGKSPDTLAAGEACQKAARAAFCPCGALPEPPACWRPACAAASGRRPVGGVTARVGGLAWTASGRACPGRARRWAAARRHAHATSRLRS